MAKKKDLDHRLRELRMALTAIKNANSHFLNTGDASYMLTISGQLRALICKGGSSMTPLLLDLARELDTPLFFYALPVEPVPPEKVVFHLIGGKSWSVQPEPGLRRYDLDMWLDLDRYYIDVSKKYRTTNQVLKHISNKEGGAHYDTAVFPIIDALKRQRHSDGRLRINGIQMFLLDLAALVYWLGARLICTRKCLKQGLDPTQDSEIERLDNEFNELEIFGPPMQVQFIIGKDHS